MKDKIKGTVIRFWRKPYPSANWCPRLTIYYNTLGLIDKSEPDHNNILNAEYANLGEFELTVKEFKQVYDFCEKTTNGFTKK